MRILVDARHMAAGELSGVGEYTQELLRALFRSESANAYTLLSTGWKRGAVRIPNKLLNLLILASGQPTLTQLTKGPFDLAFLPNLNFSTLPPDLPYVLTVHDLSWKLFPDLYSRKMRAWHRFVRPRRLITGAAGIIVPSQSAKADLLRSYAVDPDRISVIPHGVAPAFSPRPLPQDHGVRSRRRLPRRFALFVGTLEPRKNLHAVLDGMNAYRTRSGDDMHLVLVGKPGWESADLLKRLKAPDMRGWTHRLGYVAREDLPALYRMADVTLFPSLYEGFGLPILQSMASGTPVVTSAVSSMPEVAGDAALLIDPYDVGDIAAALLELQKSPALRERLRNKGLSRASGFRWEATAERTLEAFERAARRT